MKLKFDNNLQYQQEAISAVVDLFKGQTPKQSNFTVSSNSNQIGLFDTNNGIGNYLELIDDEILENLQEVQLRNGLPKTLSLKKNEYDFDIEMETGTGKTYVYLRTIFELNKQYGFSKFIIVVPSIAIKEGVKKSIEIMSDEFKNLYNNTVFNSFIYDSSDPEGVRSFAVSDNIEIMVINIDAFRKSFEDKTKESKANIIHRQSDKLNGMRPIELIAETNPIVIIDEPQSVDTTPKSKEAIKSLNPLCTLRYSATHVDKHNLIYKLDAVDAFDLALVKQIEVSSFVSKDYHNNAYLKLISVDNKKTPISAKIEIDADVKGEVKRKKVTVHQGDDLSSRKLGNRDIYEGYIVNEIYCEEGSEYVDFTSKEDILRIGKPIGDIDDLAIKEQQIRKTIEEHLNKELVLNPKGIKVLSLFFIDRVANYRYYDEDGKCQKGIYAKLFEKHYNDLIRKPKYNTLFKEIDTDTPAEGVHDGYFSKDKKGYKDTNGNTIADNEAYNLIMKDKERLLSFDSKLRFIFSHSALREGWDNPNVFQICTLNETRSNVKKRQEIGRGLRLCVNQKGERVHGFAINTLTVMANESYEEFADKLQKEYETDQKIKFGVIKSHSFANIPVKKDNGEFEYLGHSASETIYNHFESVGYIDNKGKIQESLKKDILAGTVDIPEEFSKSAVDIIAICKKAVGKLKIRPSEERKKVNLNKAVYLSDDFKALWDRIKYKTTYAVKFDSNKLMEECQIALRKELHISSPKLIYTKAKATVNIGGINTTETVRQGIVANDNLDTLPDIITYLQNETSLTRKTIVEILVGSKTLSLFKKNPQKYMEETFKIISQKMREFIVDGIKYTKIGDDEFYAQELFESEELWGYLSHNMIKSDRSAFEYVVFDSQNEEVFANRFENCEDVKCYTKLPDWFKIPTPLGSYNPDWAVLIDKDGEQKLYFVLETKGNIQIDFLRRAEHGKIMCGTKHFEALGNDVVFRPIDDFDEFIEDI